MCDRKSTRKGEPIPVVSCRAVTWLTCPVFPLSHLNPSATSGPLFPGSKQGTPNWQEGVFPPPAGAPRPWPCAEVPAEGQAEVGLSPSRQENPQTQGLVVPAQHKGSRAPPPPSPSWGIAAPSSPPRGGEFFLPPKDVSLSVPPRSSPPTPFPVNRSSGKTCRAGSGGRTFEGRQGQSPGGAPGLGAAAAPWARAAGRETRVETRRHL